MGRCLLALIFFSFVQFVDGQSAIPIGQWRNHLPLRQVVNIDADGKKILAATQYGLFSLEPEQKEFTLLTSGQGLSDVRIRFMSKDPGSSRTLIAYNNGNLDLIENQKITNIPDVFRSNVQGNKVLNSCIWLGSEAYLSTSFGVVIINTEKAEIKEKFVIGENGRTDEVNQLAISNGQLYAATPFGIRKTIFPNPLLKDFRQWVADSTIPARGNIKSVIDWNGKLLIQNADTLFIQSEKEWKTLYSEGYPISFVKVRSGKLFVGQIKNNAGSLLVYDDVLKAPARYVTPSMLYPTDALIYSGELWMGDAENGLLLVSGTNDKIFIPQSPYGIALGKGDYFNDKLVATAGAIDNSGSPLLLQAGLYIYTENNWINLHSALTPSLAQVKDINVAAFDPSGEKLIAGSYGSGLFEINLSANNQVTKLNSCLSAAANDPFSIRVTGMAFDNKGNLWIANNGSSKPLVVKKSDGLCKNFTLPFNLEGNPLNSIMIDNQNRKWIIAGSGNGLICFDDGGTPDQVNDDQWRLFKQGRGIGNLPSSNVLSVASDRNELIWVGTDKGIAIVQCGEDLFNSGLCEATLPVVLQNNVAGLLLSNEQINDIKVDGADRKWIATNNGVWLLSADGQKTIYHFTKSNGKLLSDIVKSLVIHKNTGEVFFFTSDGISSFRSTATEPQSEIKKLFVFPNPVPSGYNGTIAIRGLAANAWVRIVELDGKLVYQTRSLGGQAIWNGKNYNGERASSGAYLIYTSDENNKQQLAGKIFFIR